MRSDIYIIGKNSKLYKDFKLYLKNKYPSQYEMITAISHKELNSIKNINLVKKKAILFSLSKKVPENDLLLSEISNIFDEVLIIGSASILNKRSHAFHYSFLKMRQFNFANSLFQSGFNIKCYLFGSFNAPMRRGPQALSSFNDLRTYIFNENNFFSENIFNISGKESIKISRLYNLSEKILGIKVTALAFKIFTNSAYGYSRFS